MLLTIRIRKTSAKCESHTMTQPKVDNKQQARQVMTKAFKVLRASQCTDAKGSTLLFQALESMRLLTLHNLPQLMFSTFRQGALNIVQVQGLHLRKSSENMVDKARVKVSTTAPILHRDCMATAPSPPTASPTNSPAMIAALRLVYARSATR